MNPWTVAHQTPLSMEFSRQEYWSGEPSLSPGDLPYPVIKPGCPTLQENSLPSGLPNMCLWLSCVWLFATPWTVTRQAPLSLGFSRQKFWSGLPFPSPGDFPNPRIKPWSPTLQADSLPFQPLGKPSKHKSIFRSGLLYLLLNTRGNLVLN